MPDPEKLLATIKRASETTQQTPGRRGRIVHLPPDSEVLLSGDLHGHIGNFQLLLKRADLARNPKRHFVMQELIHGRFRYPDGNDKSHQSVDLWCALKCQYPDRVHYLPGNHELAQWTNRPIAKLDTDLNASFRDGVRTAYGKQGDAIYTAYLDLFVNLPLALRTPNRIFISHSLPTSNDLPRLDMKLLERSGHEPGDLTPGGMTYAMLWGRDTTPVHVAQFLNRVDSDILLSGHIPAEQGFSVPNDRQIILDSLGSPACSLLFPTSEPMTHAELVSRVAVL